MSCISAQFMMRLALLCLLFVNYWLTGTAQDVPTQAPTVLPTQAPSLSPSIVPTVTPTVLPSAAPTFPPSLVPTPIPSVLPSALPSFSMSPTLEPTIQPSQLPTQPPSLLPSALPTTTSPTVEPTTSSPTIAPTLAPSAIPTIAPSNLPTVLPTLVPTCSPTLAPSLPPTKLTITFDTTISLQNVSSTTWTTVSESVVINALAETLFIGTDQITYESITSQLWLSGKYELLPVFKLTLHTADYYSSLHNASALYGAVTSTMRNSAQNGGFVFAVRYYAGQNEEQNLLNVTSASFSNTPYVEGDSTSGSSDKKLSTQDLIGIYIGAAVTVSVLLGFCAYLTFCVYCFPKDLDKHFSRFGSRRRRYSGDIEGHPDVNYWLKEYDNELNELDSLADQLQHLVAGHDTEAIAACLGECEEKISSVTDIQISFYLELRLVRDTEVKAKLDAKAKLMEAQYGEISKFVAQVKATQVQKYEGSSSYARMKQRIEELEAVMLVSEEIVAYERAKTAEAVAKSIAKGKVSNAVVTDMQVELQHNLEENAKLRQMLEHAMHTHSGREIVDPEAGEDLARLQAQLTKASEEIDIFIAENENYRRTSQEVEKKRDDVIAELVMQKVVNGNIANEIEETKLNLHKLRKKAEAIEQQRAASGLPPANLLGPSTVTTNSSGNSSSIGGGGDLRLNTAMRRMSMSLDDRLAEHQQRTQNLSLGIAGGGSSSVSSGGSGGRSSPSGMPAYAPPPIPVRPVSPDFVTPIRPPGGSGGRDGYYPNSGGSAQLTSSQLRGAIPNTGGTSVGGGSSHGSGVMMRGFGSSSNGSISTAGGGRGSMGGRGGGGAGSGRASTSGSNSSRPPTNPYNNNNNSNRSNYNY